MHKYEIHQTCIKDVTDEQELEMLQNNFLHFGWTQENVDKLKRDGFMQREGKLSDGNQLTEIIRVTPKFKVIQNAR